MSEEIAKKEKEQLFDPETQITETEEEIVVHWVNKYGVHMDIKTRRGGLIHALWLAEHERRNRKRLEESRNLSIKQPEIIDMEIVPERIEDAKDTD